MSPADLLLVARQLADTSGTTPPTDAQLRRAVSTAYYAVFHTILKAAAERFMGPGQERTAGYSLLYRSFNHGKMRAVCEKLGALKLSPNTVAQLGRSTVSQDVRDVVNTFPGLQDERHQADYDPVHRFLASDVTSTITSAADAMEAFDRIPLDERTDVLALMMVGVRS